MKLFNLSIIVTNTHLLVASCVVAPTCLGSSILAADRLVLVQAVWDNHPPHYLVIKGGRNLDRRNIVFKPGRHSPADEWILREIDPGVVALETSDPFFPPLSIYYEWQGAKLPDWTDAHLLRLRSPRKSVDCAILRNR